MFNRKKKVPREVELMNYARAQEIAQKMMDRKQAMFDQQEMVEEIFRRQVKRMVII